MFRDSKIKMNQEAKAEYEEMNKNILAKENKKYQLNKYSHENKNRLKIFRDNENKDKKDFEELVINKWMSIEKEKVIFKALKWK